MASITVTPAKELTITWPLLPDDFELSDQPAENTDQPLIAAALRQSIIQLPERLQEMKPATIGLPVLNFF